jgi:hypothetical protein
VTVFNVYEIVSNRPDRRIFNVGNWTGSDSLMKVLSAPGIPPLHHVARNDPLRENWKCHSVVANLLNPGLAEVTCFYEPPPYSRRPRR